MEFVANLRTETVDVFDRHGIQPSAYLLSSHRISPTLLAAAADIRSRGIPLVADNGSKRLIEATVDAFKPRADAIRDDARELRRRIGHVPRTGEVPQELRRRAAELADEVIRHAAMLAEAIDHDTLLTDQLSMNPTALIAQEDFSAACLIALDLEREITGWRIGRFDTLNRRSLRRWERVRSDPRCRGIDVHAVLGALDYNTARSAGRLAAAAGAEHVAIGIAGIMLDPSAVDFFVMETARVTLDRAAPRRYVRLAQIIRGIGDGFAQTGARLRSFHCLGLGAPRMFPIPAAALGEETHITTDATSPIHDATRDHVLYDPRAFGDRTSLRSIVRRIMDGKDWPFLSPFTKAFRDEFGHDPDRARATWGALGRPTITDELLAVPGGVTEFVPLFSLVSSDVRIAAMKTHIAHNHWVAGRLCAMFRAGQSRRRAARSVLGSVSTGESAVSARGRAAALSVLARRAD